MALKFEVETLEDVSEDQREMYVEYEGKYRLDVEGVDDAKELKTALQKEREERKAAKARLRELEESKKKLDSEKEQADKQRLLEKEEFKSLYEAELEKQKSYEERISQLQNEFEGYKQTISQKTIQAEVTAIAANESAGGTTTELLSEQLMKFAKANDGEIVYEMGGVEVPKEKVIEQLKTKYPTLFKGSGADGSGATGSTDARAAGSQSKGNLGGSREERLAAITSRFNLKE